MVKITVHRLHVIKAKYIAGEVATARIAALRRLQADCALCGVPWEGMSLDPKWNVYCAAAAEICKRLGRWTRGASTAAPCSFIGGVSLAYDYVVEFVSDKRLKR